MGGKMVRKKLKPIKTLSGNGEIRKAGKHFANCTYQLQVEQEIMISESSSDRQEIPGGVLFQGRSQSANENYENQEFFQAWFLVKYSPCICPMEADLKPTLIQSTT